MRPLPAAGASPHVLPALPRPGHPQAEGPSRLRPAPVASSWKPPGGLLSFRKKTNDPTPLRPLSWLNPVYSQPRSLHSTRRPPDCHHSTEKLVLVPRGPRWSPCARPCCAWVEAPGAPRHERPQPCSPHPPLTSDHTHRPKKAKQNS